MIDIVSLGDDMGIYSTQNYKAKNILSVQLGDLEYAPLLGIDLRYFLSEDFKFQNDSFKAYLIEVLANSGINVASVEEQIETLFTRFNFNLTPEETSSGMVAR